MTSTLIEAITAASHQSAEAVLGVGSDHRPCTTNLAEVVAAGQRMGTRMIATGIAPGDIISCMLPNWREWLVVAVAASHAGAVMLPIVTIYGAKGLGFFLDQSGAKWLFTPGSFRNVDYTRVVADCGALPKLERHIILGPEFEALEASGPISEPVSVPSEDLALLVFTSGTTSDPKGVMHSARGLLAELESMRLMRDESEDDAILSPWPPGHVAGALSMYRYLCQGAPVVLMDQWDAAQAAELIERYHVTSSSGKPFHLSGMMLEEETNGLELSSLPMYIVDDAPSQLSYTLNYQTMAPVLTLVYCSCMHP